MKKILIIINTELDINDYNDILEKLFDNMISVDVQVYQTGLHTILYKYDLIMISILSIYEAIKDHLPQSMPIVFIKRTITNAQFQIIETALSQIDFTEPVAVVNSTQDIAIETVTLMKTLGFNHHNLIPITKDTPHTENFHFALTPAEEKFVPESISTVINFGNRVFDTATILDIIAALKLEKLLQSPEFNRYFNELKTFSKGVEAVIGKSLLLEQQFESLLDIFESGILFLDLNGKIVSCNPLAEKLFHIDRNQMINTQIEAVLPNLNYQHVIRNNTKSYTVSKIDNCDTSIKILPINRYYRVRGIALILTPFAVSERQQQLFRKKILGKGHVARYSFDDILTENPEMIQLKHVAKRMAKSNSTILITGETGTGKELFANAIHLSSHRSNCQFLAINCASFPPNLLESELFGYEEGAFTGARKGGKLGIFELANGGTLFLDEIAEIPIDLQSRLLRALEEREIMRIGSDRKSIVDIRLIAATNKNLDKLVEEGRFREDLFYRLNVLPLKLLPLRKRNEDICLLLDQLKKKEGYIFRLTAKAQAAMRTHPFKGNVRELKNYVEYLGNLDKQTIEIEDLPFIDLQNKQNISEPTREQKGTKENFVLSCLKEAKQNHQKIGRRALKDRAEKENLLLSEYEIRSILQELSDLGLVHISNGRGGTSITEKGLDYLNEVDKSGKI